MDEILSTIIAASAGVLSGVIAAKAGRKKNDADAASSITEAAMSLVEPLTKRVEVLETGRVEAEKELKILRPLPELVKRLMAGIDKLIEQIRCLGHEPIWTPEMETRAIPMRKNGRGK